MRGEGLSAEGVGVWVLVTFPGVWVLVTFPGVWVLAYVTCTCPRCTGAAPSRAPSPSAIVILIASGPEARLISGGMTCALGAPLYVYL